MNIYTVYDVAAFFVVAGLWLDCQIVSCVSRKNLSDLGLATF